MNEWVSIWAAFLFSPLPCDQSSEHCVRRESVEQQAIEHHLSLNCAVLECLLHLI